MAQLILVLWVINYTIGLLAPLKSLGCLRFYKLDFVVSDR